METSEIHNLIALPETTSEIRFLLQEFVKEFESQNSKAWNKEVKETNKKYHCHELLKKGIGEISQSYYRKEDELTGEELVCLYNYYYFPILFESSFLIYKELWDNTFANAFISNNSLIFADIGSGTLPVSLAYSEVFKKNKSEHSVWNEEHITEFPMISFYFTEYSGYLNEYGRELISNYCGRCLDFEWEIDSSSRIYPPLFNIIFPRNHPLCLDNFTFGYNRQSIKNELDNVTYKYNENTHHIEGNSSVWFSAPIFIDSFHANKSFIVNLNYLRSESVFNFEKKINEINELLLIYRTHNIAIIFQNNGNVELQNKWDIFKSGIAINSIKTGVVRLSCNENIEISYEVLVRSKYERYNYD
jgi:hypothetical protein